MTDWVQCRPSRGARRGSRTSCNPLRPLCILKHTAGVRSSRGLVHWSFATGVLNGHLCHHRLQVSLPRQTHIHVSMQHSHAMHDCPRRTLANNGRLQSTLAMSNTDVLLWLLRIYYSSSVLFWQYDTMELANNGFNLRRSALKISHQQGKSERRQTQTVTYVCLEQPCKAA